MRLAMRDVKKTISRKSGEPRLVPYLLRPGERTHELEILIALYDVWIGRARATWPDDRTAEQIGDYRLARCLENILSEWYLWQSPAWPENGDVAAALAARAIAGPSQLRLALYDFVSETYGGFLRGDERDAGLDAFARDLTIPRAVLDELLYLDSDARATLARIAPEAPTPAQLAMRYNQRVFEALLASASQVEWLLTPSFTAASGEALGATVKRVCFLARRMGIQYDIAFTSGDERPISRVAEQHAPYLVTEAQEISSPLLVTLQGPQEMTGAPSQYGERLARLCRALLGYRRDTRLPGRSALAGSGLTGVATVYLHGRPLAFDLDPKLLKLIAPAREVGMLGEVAETPDADTLFDSSLELRLHEQFAALERDGEARGWRLEREPEPIIVGSTILVPDFAITRGRQRVYLEIAGYWRPEYRERKARKLAAVGKRVALVLAAPETARAEFATLASDFPMLWYRQYVSADALLALLDSAYNDRNLRLAGLDLAAIGAEVVARGYIPPVESMALLRCYSRGELARALDLLREHSRQAGEPAPEWHDGLGLCAASWVMRLLDAIRAFVERADEHRLPLAELCSRLSSEPGAFPAISESIMEALALQAGLRVARSSIFDVVVCGDEADIPAESPDAPPSNVRAAQPRRHLRRTHSRTMYTTQSIFPPEHPGPDNPEPDIPPRALQ